MGSRGIDLSLNELVDRLIQKDVRSDLLERVKRRVDVEQAHDDLQREIAAEMAGALGRSEAKVHKALLLLELLGHELDAAAPLERAACVVAFNEARERALAARRDLEIHREAVGFRRPPGWHELYPVPARAR